MNETNQTREGFIKSMIMFVVLLGICFAPFFAFNRKSQVNTTSNEVIVSEQTFSQLNTEE